MTDEPQAELRTIGDKPVLRFERRLAHPPAKVWRAVTEPAEMAHWFPAAVETELRPGASMRFAFPEEAPLDVVGQGEILELDPPKVYAFRWNEDVLRFEILPEDTGCRLVFTQTMGGGWLGRLGTARTAAGWDACLAALLARLDDRSGTMPTEWLVRMERYHLAFGLDEGEAEETGDGFRLHFARDLVWKPVEEMWALLVDGARPEPGGPPPVRATNGEVPAGRVTAVEAPRVLEYEWLDDGAPAGLVRWEFTHDALHGVRVEVTQTVPARLAGLRAAALAAWHVQMELFFAASFGEIRCPWPRERAEELAKRYTERLG